MTFWCGGHLFGVPVNHVQEVLRDHPKTPVPLAPVAIGGVMNLRGRIVMEVRMNSLLGSEEPDGDASVIVRWEDELAALRVDRVGDVVELNGASPGGCRNEFRGRARELIREVYEWNDRLVLLLDTGAAVEMAWKRSQAIDRGD